MYCCWKSFIDLFNLVGGAILQIIAPIYCTNVIAFEIIQQYSTLKKGSCQLKKLQDQHVKTDDPLKQLFWQTMILQI